MIKQIIDKAKTLPENKFITKYKNKIYNVEGSSKNCTYTVIENDYMVFIHFIDNKYYEHRIMIKDKFNRYKSIQGTDPEFIG